MKKWIFFDMDGTLNKFYEVPNWLEYLKQGDPYPYQQASVNLNMSALARKLRKLQRAGYRIGIISWLSKTSTAEYDKLVIKAKLEWLNKHLKSVTFDRIHIVPYGMSKKKICGDGILFDDEERNRNDWGANAYEPSEIFNVLQRLV